MTFGYSAYPEYKESEVDWVDKLPEHWESNKLRYTFSFKKGLTITKENLFDEGVPCVNYGEVHSKYGFEVDPDIHPLKCVSEEYLKSSPSALLSKGDLVFADTSEDIEGSGNFTQLISDERIFAGYHTIIAQPEDRQCSRFYAYLLDSIELRTQVRYAVKGVKVFSVTQAILKSIDIWLPPIEERRKIADFLDHETAKIDTLIEKQQQLITLLKEKRQAVISHAVTKGLNPDAPMRDSGVDWLGEVPEHWEEFPLKFLFGLKHGYAFNSDDFLDRGNFILMTPGNFDQRGGFRNKNPEKYYIGKDIPEDFILKAGQLLVAMTEQGPGLLGCSLFVPEQEVYLHNQRLGLVQNLNKDKVSQTFLFHLFNSKRYRAEVSVSSTGAKVKHTSPEKILSVKVWLPPLFEQNEIANYIARMLEKIDLLTGNSEHTVNLLYEKRAALISAAVTGKIDVRNWQAPTPTANQPDDRVAAA